MRPSWNAPSRRSRAATRRRRFEPIARSSKPVRGSCPATSVIRIWRDGPAATTRPACARTYAALPDDDGPVWPYVEGRLEGEFDERRQALFEESLKRDPSFYYANLGLARMWHGLGRTQNELSVLEKAIQAKPASPDANLALARVLAELGRGEEAAPHFRNYLEQRPGDREATRQFVRLLVYTLRRPGEAEPWVERLLADDAEDVPARMDAAAIAWLRGDRDRAAALYRQVIALDPGVARAVLNLGNLYYASPERPDDEKRRDWPHARDAYRVYLAIAKPEELYDMLDVYTAVPYRLARIDEFLGPLPDDVPSPTLEDLARPDAGNARVDHP